MLEAGRDRSSGKRHIIVPQVTVAPGPGRMRYGKKGIMIEIGIYGKKEPWCPQIEEFGDGSRQSSRYNHVDQRRRTMRFPMRSTGRQTAGVSQYSQFY